MRVGVLVEIDINDVVGICGVSLSTVMGGSVVICPGVIPDGGVNGSGVIGIWVEIG